MAELYDVTLGGIGYMVAPKSYRRGMDSPGRLGSAPVRAVQAEWAGGLALNGGERDRFAYSLGLLPTRDGRAVRGAGRRSDVTAAGSATARQYHAIVDGRPYIGAGLGLRRPDRIGMGLNPNNFGGITALTTALVGQVDGMATDGNVIWLSVAGSTIVSWDVGAGGPLDTSSTLQLHGLAHYAGDLWGGILVSGQWRIGRKVSNVAIDGSGYPIDSQPTHMITGRDGMYTATRGGLWRTVARSSGASGLTLSVEHEQLVMTGANGRADDWSYIAEHGGQVYAWYNGGICRYHAGGSAPAQMAPTGLWGAECRGLISTMGYLCALVRLEDSEVPNPGCDLWLYDGRGWWRLSNAAPGDVVDLYGIAPTASYLDNASLIGYDPAGTWRGFQLRGLPSQPGHPNTGELIIGPLYGANIDEAKSWCRVGAEFGDLPYRAIGGLEVELAYSTDGNTWTVAATATLTTSAPATVAANVPTAVLGKVLYVRYRYTGGSALERSPTLRALWAEYRPIEEVVPKRHWQFDVLVADEQTRRNGGKEPRNGKQIAADLWAQWEARGTLTFRDVDYDLAAVTRNVRIVGVDELVERADERGRWGEAVCRVRLVEV